MRPKIDVGESTRDKVKDIGDMHGLNMPAAWALVVEEGIEALQEQADDVDGSPEARNPPPA